MRITAILCQNIPGPKGWWPRPLIHWFGKGVWGPRKMRYTFNKEFNKKMYKQGPLTVTPTDAQDFLPPNVKVYDALEVAREDFALPLPPINHPWPYTKIGAKGTLEDSNFRERPAWLYNRPMTLYEGIKGALNFTNSILESNENFPESINRKMQQVTLDQDWSSLLNQRLDWVMKDDSSLIKMPNLRVFPRINFKQLKKPGIHPFRQDDHVLKTYHELATRNLSLQSGFCDLRVVDAPHLIVPFERRGKLCILNLASNFMSLRGSDELLKSANTSSNSPLFSEDPISTVSKNLEDISPVDWRINFQETNFYPIDYGFGIPENYKVDTIYIGNNTTNPKPQPDRMVQARALLYCYGAAVAQARSILGLADFADPGTYLPLEKPLTIKAVFYNMSKNNLGFVCLQLNTLSFESKLKNQVWTVGPFDFEDKENIMKAMIAIQ